MGRFRFALAFNGSRLERWHVRCLEELEPVAELALAVAAPGPSPARTRSRLLDRYAKRVERSAVVEVGDRFADLVPPTFGQGSTEAVDFVLGLGNVAVPPRLAEAAPHGVWRFEHELGGSRLPFVGQVCRGEDVTRAALLRVDVGGQPLSTIAEGVFRTDITSYPRSRDRILAAIAPWPARACRVRCLGQVESRPAARVDTEVSCGFTRLAAGVALRRLALAWERFFRHPQWNIGVLNLPVEMLLAPGGFTGEDVEWFPLEGKAGFLADPFAVERDAGLRVFCEYFDYRDSLGRIVILEHTEEGFATERRIGSTFQGHSSYPFLLDLPEGLHCVPETADAGEVALYRVGDRPERWEKVAVLLDGFPGLDSTVFRHDGRWWLMCTRKGPQEDAELWVWHASTVEGPWTPHDANPVKTDVRGARPAGPPFVHDGLLYRPAQDCSRTYGGRVTVHRVDELTPTTFAEEQVAVLEASPRSRYPLGPHTVMPVGDRILVDGRRTVFVAAAFRAFLRVWARDVGCRLRRR